MEQGWIGYGLFVIAAVGLVAYARAYYALRVRYAFLSDQLESELRLSKCLQDQAETAETRLRWVDRQLDSLLLVSRVRYTDSVLERPDVVVFKEPRA